MQLMDMGFGDSRIQLFFHYSHLPMAEARKKISQLNSINKRMKEQQFFSCSVRIKKPQKAKKYYVSENVPQSF